MSRFVRASKYRHVFGQTGKRENNLENCKITNSAWDTNIVSCSGSYISINWNASGGGAFAIMPLPSPFTTNINFPYKLPDIPPLARSHTAPVLDTAWSPHDDAIVASAGEDGKLLLWKVEDQRVFDGWGSEGWVPKDFDPLLRIDASARKVGQVEFHPTAKNVVASASGEHVVKLWDLANPEAPAVTLSGHSDSIQSIAFNRTGTVLATTSRDRKLRLFDPRAGGTAVRATDGHQGVKGSRVVWCGDLDMIATTGFSKMSERQVNLWETGGLSSVKNMPIDQSSGVIMPFWSDNRILFLAGKGDGNIRYYEYESDSLIALSEYKSTDPQRGMAFLPRRALNVSDCEIARAYKVHGSTIEPIAFIVPRKADGFQSDIYPPAPSTEPSLSAGEFFDGSKTPVAKMVDLASGAITTTSPGSMPTPTPTSSAPAPTPAAAPSPIQRQPSFAEPTPQPAAPAPARVPSPVQRAPTPPPIQRQASQTSLPPPAPTLVNGHESASNDAEVSELHDENARLTAELREAREKIQELELAVESSRANARKAAEALLNS